MPTDIAYRRAVFQNFLACYHNSFAGPVAGVVEHSPGFIHRVVEASAADPSLAAATLRLDPRLTATDQGAVAFSIAKAVSEDKQLAPHFIDLELVEDVITAYFEARVEIAKAEKVLGEVAKVGIISKPGDRISDQTVSDVYIVAIETNKGVGESIVEKMKGKMPPFLKKKVKDKDGDCPESEKGGDASPDEKDGAREGLEYRPGVEAAHYNLPEDVFGDEALAACTALPEGVKAVYRSLYSPKALDAAMSVTIEESAAPDKDDANGQRNRLLRILAGRGYLAAGAPAPAWGESVVGGVAKVTEAFAADKAAFAEGVAVSPEAYARAVEEVAVALDASIEKTADILEAVADRILDQGLEAVSAEKRAAVLARIQAAASKNEGAVVARCLTSLANAAMFEAGLYPNAESAAVVKAWGAYIAEAMKAPVVPAGVIDGVADDILGLAS